MMNEEQQVTGWTEGHDEWFDYWLIGIVPTSDRRRLTPSNELRLKNRFVRQWDGISPFAEFDKKRCDIEELRDKFRTGSPYRISEKQEGVARKQDNRQTGLDLKYLFVGVAIGILTAAALTGGQCLMPFIAIAMIMGLFLMIGMIMDPESTESMVNDSFQYWKDRLTKD